jgi:hypothetical protein
MADAGWTPSLAFAPIASSFVNFPRRRACRPRPDRQVRARTPRRPGLAPSPRRRERLRAPAVVERPVKHFEIFFSAFRGNSRVSWQKKAAVGLRRALRAKREGRKRGRAGPREEPRPEPTGSPTRNRPGRPRLDRENPAPSEIAATGESLSTGLEQVESPSLRRARVRPSITFTLDPRTAEVKDYFWKRESRERTGPGARAPPAARPDRREFPREARFARRPLLC